MYIYKISHDIKINEKNNLTSKRDYPHCNCVPLYCLNSKLKHFKKKDFLDLKSKIDNNPENYIISNLSFPKKFI